MKYDNTDRRYQPQGRSAPKQEEVTPPPETEELMGLYLAGTVVDRSRRMVPRENPVTEIITYTLETPDRRRYYVDDFAPTGYHDRGEYIVVPIYVKPYRKKNNDLAYTLCVLKEYQNKQGESF